MATPGQKSEFSFATPCTSKVDYDQGNTPKVLGIGALAGRNNVFLYHETLLKGNVACEILTYDLARCWQVYTLGCHGSEVLSVAFSPNGTRIVSGSASIIRLTQWSRTISGFVDNDLVKIWNAEKGAEVSCCVLL